MDAQETVAVPSADGTPKKVRRKRSKKRPQATERLGARMAVDYTLVAILVGLGVYVATSPSTVYAPTPKVVLYLLMSLIPPLVLARQVMATFEIRWQGVFVAAGGTAGAIFAMLWLLTFLSKPEAQIAIYDVRDVHGRPVSLENDGAVEVHSTRSDVDVTRYIDGSRVVVVYPDQVASITFEVTYPPSDAAPYSAELTYTGSRVSILRLGEELRR